MTALRQFPPSLRLVDSKHPGARGTRTARKSSSRASRRWVPSRDANLVRWSKVLTAQARIAVNYYDRPDVKQMVLDAVLRELKRR